jgi:hypothetical protein
VLGDGSGFVEINKRSHTMKQRLKIGISACFMYPDPTRNAYAPKTLQYIEESMAHWITRGGALPVMVPSSFSEGESPNAGVDADDYAQWLDALVLHGGADVWPGSYGEEPLNPNWGGDRQRDAYEIALVRAFVAAGKPVCSSSTWPLVAPCTKIFPRNFLNQNPIATAPCLTTIFIAWMWSLELAYMRYLPKHTTPKSIASITRASKT